MPSRFTPNPNDDDDDEQTDDYIPDARVQGGVPSAPGDDRERDIHPAVARHDNQIRVSDPSDRIDRDETAAELRTLADKLERGDITPREFTHDKIRPGASDDLGRLNQFGHTFHTVLGMFVEPERDATDD